MNYTKNAAFPDSAESMIRALYSYFWKTRFDKTIESITGLSLAQSLQPAYSGKTNAHLQYVPKKKLGVMKP